MWLDRLKHLLCIACLLFYRTAFAQTSVPHDAAYYFQKGEQALTTKDYIRAHAHFNECLRLDPHFAEAYRSRGIAREFLGEHAKALNDYNVYVDLKPQDAQALFSRAVLRYESKQYLLARQDFLKVLTFPTAPIKPGEEKTDATGRIIITQSDAKDHIYNFLGLSETKLERYPIAITWFDSAILVNPKNSAYWANRGVAKWQRGDSEGATKDYEQSLQIDPANVLASTNLATVKSSASEKEIIARLLDELNLLIKGNPLSEKATVKLQKNDLKGALMDYNEMIKLGPKEVEYYTNRGLVKERMNDFPGALADFTKATQVDPKNARAWVCRGNLETKTKRWKDGVEDFTIAINLKADYAIAYHNRAIARFGAGQGKEACEDLAAAEKLGGKVDAGLKGRICK